MTAIVNPNPNLDIENLQSISRLFRGGWMVPGRMSHLANLIDFTQLRTVFDVGSWHLDQSIEFLLCLEAATIHAFEPHPESANECRKKKETINLPHRNRVNIHQIALTDKVGEISFYPLDTERTNSTNIGMSSTLKIKDEDMRGDSGGKWIQKEIKVKATTLDEWCSETSVYPDALWVDVQGAELSLYNGGKNVLRNNVKVIMTEVGIKPYYEGHSLKPDIDRLLVKELGFVELKSAFKLNDEYEADAIYIKPSVLTFSI